MLEEVKLLLEIKDDTRDELLNLLIKNAKTQILGRLEELKEPPTEVPKSLSYIVLELVVMRYNRIGAEGISSQSVEGYSAQYLANDFAPYESVITAYLNKYREPKTGVVRFL
ncbi:head-tail connector protein [Allofustis seminis]|uniref:head-tail connector protein n=1 Tax=Allofustis seminis TaxID=166939 RepID=UPI000378537E|nr:head-tail connector protein [Allofustis seminis]